VTVLGRPDAPGEAAGGGSPPRLAVPQFEVDDLTARLRNTRWATVWPTTTRSSSTGSSSTGWAAGTDTAELHRLVGYWRDGFDWRAQERRINALPARVVDVDGLGVHVLVYEGEHPDALPIVLTHGWPSTVLELTALAERLARPSAHGGRAEDAFTVVVPSLPGFGFTPQQPTVPGALPTHELWHRLMRDGLGFDRYAAHGGDLGAGVTARLAHAHPESVVGIHVLAVAPPAHVDPASLTDAERAHLEEVAAWQVQEGGYQHEQATRPLTLAPGLSDSPAGLLAWLLEKYHAWSDRRGGRPATLDDDLVLTQVSLYWFTNTISTSFRPYWEFAQGTLPPLGQVPVPTAVALFPADLTHPPRSWAERTYNVQRWTPMTRGGHFAALEEPALLGADITEFFRDLR
jgi:pimeloyl-ACP methyl ester carboxylesterase